jgi:hypothetical protein
VPDTVIDGGPPQQTTSRSAVFRFSARTAPASSFECSVDYGTPARCKSPAQFGRLRPGEHVLTVAALSSAGDADPTPATFTWTVVDELVPSQPAPKPKPKPKKKKPPPDLIG